MKKIFKIDEICGEGAYYNLRNYEPQNEEVFCLEIAIKLQYIQYPDWDIERFTVTVASPQGYVGFSNNDNMWQDKIIFMKKYNYELLRKYIERVLDECQSSTIIASIFRLNTFFRSETVDNLGIDTVIDKLKNG
jgi:hypothetical protein